MKAPIRKTTRTTLLALAAAATLLAFATAARAGLKDDAFGDRRDAFREALRDRAREDATPIETALKAIREFAATRDSRVLKELTKALSPVTREVEKARAELDEATEKLDKVREPYFRSVEDYYRKNGKFPDQILVSQRDAMETLQKAQAVVATKWNDWVRIRDAMHTAIGDHLLALGDERDEVWKEAVKNGAESKDAAVRAAFATCLERLPGAEPEKLLLKMESEEEDRGALVSILNAIGRRRMEAGVPRLIERLKSEDWAVAAAAIEGLARVRRPEVIPALIARLETADGRVMADLLDTLFEITGKHNPDTFAGWNTWWTEEGESFLKRWSRDKKVRQEAIDALAMANAQEIDIPAELAALLPTEPDAEVRQEILENLSIHRSNFARAVLLDVLRDPDRELRLAAIRGLAHYRHLSVPEALIALVDDADKEELYAIFNSLRTLWGGSREFSVERPDKEALHRWWDNNKDRVARHFIRLGAEDIAAGKRAPAGDEQRWQDRNFYGIQVLSKNALFVVDVSLSMEEPAVKGQERKKIAVAKAELSRAINSLPADATFGVIVFSSKPEIYGDGMTEASDSNKKKAVEWIEGLETRAATNIFDTLELCFLLGTDRSPVRSFGTPDTIFFVSDGAPTVGKFTDNPSILEYVRRWNANRRIKIHTIGVGDDHDIEFLRKLAEENGGFYVAR